MLKNRTAKPSYWKRDDVKVKRFLIIIPTFNEEKNIGKVLDKLKGYDVLVVNDASSDNTRNIVESKGFKCISHKENKGYCNALVTGYRYALEHDYDYVIQMDADGQHDTCNIEPLKKEIAKDEYDIILGSRFLKNSNCYKTGFLHNLGYKYFSLLVKILTGKTIKDASTGLQALNKKAYSYCIQHLDLKYPDANYVIHMLLHGFKIKELPATMHERVSGTSMHRGIPIKYVWYVTRKCLKERGNKNVCMAILRRGFRNFPSICLFNKLHSQSS